MTIFTILSACPDTRSLLDNVDDTATTYPPREKMSNREQHLQDQEIMVESVCNLELVFRILMDPKETTPIHDEFTRAVVAWRKRRAFQDGQTQISFWLMFAAKAHLVSHHVLGDYNSRGCHDLYKTGISIGHTLREHIEVHDFHAMPFGVEPNLAAAKRLQKVILQWATAPTEEKEHFTAVSTFKPRSISQNSWYFETEN